ncbi:alpha-tubulin binding protein [Aureococcus anophagefferens]|nr:alpha-tubulin binding protein [Aureococcus anophagefferens]
MDLPPGLASSSGPPGLHCPPAKKARTDGLPSWRCPYLDTINRHLLDFDFEKVCSQSLTNQNVYSCLVCGKFFQGRGRHTHAYTHSTQTGHHMFINLETCRIYCLPENYEVVDSSLDDVVRCLRPVFGPERIGALDGTTTLARDVHGVAYLPGFCGLNNLKKTDYVNVVVHALAHVAPLRDFFLRPENYAHCPAPLVHKFGELLRKLWSRDNFKSVISPHELVQEITVASKLRFQIGETSDAADFLGDVRVETLSRRTHLTKRDEADVDDTAVSAEAQGWKRDERDLPFLYLTLDVPATPLFKDTQGGNIVPQIPLFDVLTKYNGVKLSDSVKSGVQSRKRYVIRRLPKYLIFHFARFTKNNFADSEKNPTIVHIPVKDLELRDQFALEGEAAAEGAKTKYDLCANAATSDQWYEIQDLHVSETMPQLIGLSESLLCIYQRRD